MSIYSPDVEAWLMGLGPNPFGGSPTPLPPGSFGDEDTMDILSKILTAQNKGNDVMSDPAQIAQYGTGDGGFGPEAFDPSRTYESVKAPGFMQMQRYLQSTDPFMSFVAQRLDEGASAYQVSTEIETMISNGGPEGERMKMALPRIRDDGSGRVTAGGIDYGRVDKIVGDLEQTLINDPSFNSMDPTTDLPANMTEEESEASRYFREADLPSPYESYSPDTLASPQILSQERHARDLAMPRAGMEAQSAQDRFAMLSDQLKQSRSTSYGDETDRNARPVNRGAAPTQGDDFLAGSMIASQRPSVDERAIMDSAMGFEPGTASTRGRRTPSQNNVQQRSRLMRDVETAGRERLVTQNRATKASNAINDDTFAQLERQAMMRRMTQAGYTPFNQSMRARQGSIYNQ